MDDVISDDGHKVAAGGDLNKVFAGKSESSDDESSDDGKKEKDYMSKLDK